MLLNPLPAKSFILLLQATNSFQSCVGSDALEANLLISEFLQLRG